MLATVEANEQIVEGPQGYPLTTGPYLRRRGRGSRPVSGSADSRSIPTEVALHGGRHTET